MFTRENILTANPAKTPADNIAQYPGAARERLLLAASDLFCRYGINATGVDSIVAAAGTAKTTLYKAFGSKEGLIEAVLEREGSTWRQWFSDEVDALPGGASDKLVHIFDVLKRWFAEENFYGCPFINAVGEHDKEDDRIRLLTLKRKDRARQDHRTGPHRASRRSRRTDARTQPADRRRDRRGVDHPRPECRRPRAQRRGALDGTQLAACSEELNTRFA